MKTCLSAILLALSLLAPRLTAAEGQPAKPGPEHQKLAAWTGKWKFEGEHFAGPLGLAGPEKGTMESHLILGGFFQVNKTKAVGPAGPVATFEVIAYDDEKGHYQSNFYVNDGHFNKSWKADNATCTVQGDTWTWSWLEEKDGKKYQVRQIGTVAPDRKTSSWVTTYSEDGQNWKKRNEFRAKKTGKLRDE